MGISAFTSTNDIACLKLTLIYRMNFTLIWVAVVIKLHVKPCINFFSPRNEKDRWCLFAVFEQILQRFHAILGPNVAVLWWNLPTFETQTCLFSSVEFFHEDFLFFFTATKTVSDLRYKKNLAKMRFRFF